MRATWDPVKIPHSKSAILKYCGLASIIGGKGGESGIRTPTEKIIELCKAEGLDESLRLERITALAEQIQGEVRYQRLMLSEMSDTDLGATMNRIALELGQRSQWRAKQKGLQDGDQFSL